MNSAFMIGAWLLALCAIPFVSQATSGVAIICFACFIGITVRVSQADEHHKAVLAALARKA